MTPRTAVPGTQQHYTYNTQTSGTQDPISVLKHSYRKLPEPNTVSTTYTQIVPWTQHWSCNTHGGSSQDPTLTFYNTQMASSQNPTPSLQHLHIRILRSNAGRDNEITDPNNTQTVLQNQHSSSQHLDRWLPSTKQLHLKHPYRLLPLELMASTTPRQ